MTLRVNGTVIPEAAIQYELDRLVKFYSAHMSAEEIRGQMDSLRKRAREQAIGSKLLIEEASRLDLLVSPADVRQALDTMVENAGGEEAFEELLARQGIAMDVLRMNIVQGRKVDMLIEQITAGVEDPGEAEIRAHFEAHQEEYRKPEKARASHILVTPASGKAADHNVAKSLLLELRKRIDEGADFGDLAAAHSACPSGQRAGGSLGWFTPGMMVPEFDRVVFGLAEGEISDIVQTQFGYHLIMRTGAEPGEPAEFDDMREQIRDFLRHVRRGEVIAAHVQELKEKSAIEDDGKPA